MMKHFKLWWNNRTRNYWMYQRHNLIKETIPMMTLLQGRYMSVTALMTTVYSTCLYLGSHSLPVDGSIAPSLFVFCQKKKNQKQKPQVLGWMLTFRYLGCGRANAVKRPFKLSFHRVTISSRYCFIFLFC